jgi:hypothetical protein
MSKRREEDPRAVLGKRRMLHVSQEEPDGCFIACSAMVLNLTYKEVKARVPKPTVVSARARLKALRDLRALAGEYDLRVIDCTSPLVPRAGLRYVAGIPTDKTDWRHCIAIDEEGTAFDPMNRESRESWSSYSIKTLLEFFPERPNRRTR